MRELTDYKLIDSAVAKLGPERSARALRAFAPDNEPEGWEACALALAYGERGELLAAAAGHRYPWSIEKTVIEALGLTLWEVEAVIDAFDVGGDAGVYLRAALEAEAATRQPAPEPEGPEPEEPAWEDAPQHEGELVYAAA